MGAVCCCLNVHDDEAAQGSNGHASNSRSCNCPGCFITNLAKKCGALFGRGGSHPVPPANPVAASRTAVAPIVSSEENRRPPRAQPNTNSHTQSQLQQDVLVVKQENRSSHPRIGPAPSIEVVPQMVKEKDNDVKEGSRVCSSKSVRVVPLKEESVPAYVLSMFEDEDVCPTCLDGYTPENPKIITKCSHHYHLGCIYEWMERSETCPVCGKLMMFDEST